MTARNLPKKHHERIPVTEAVDIYAMLKLISP
jgi:hypothetical protein